MTMRDEGQVGVVIDSGGYRLLGTFYTAPGGDPKPTAILLHGVPGIEKNVDLAHALRENGWNCLLIHYRGCWGSEGTYRLKTVPVDVIAALDFLGRDDTGRVDPSRVALIGHSLGGWAAILAAAADERVKAVTVYSPVVDPQAFAMDEDVAAAEFTPWINGITPAEFTRQWRALTGPFNALNEVAKVEPRPLLIIHGELDEVVPVEQGQALYEAAGQPKKLVRIPNGNHALAWQRPLLRRYLLDWLHTIEWETSW